MTFSDKDKEFMRIALEEAKTALEKGDYPVGAVLVADGELIDKTSNSLQSEKNWASHAEASLIRKNSATIRSKIKNKSKIELFTTLEPCLMCLGSSVMHRISRIVFACPDPYGGATKIDPKSLTEWYQRTWPKIEGGLMREESYEPLVQFMKNHENWSELLRLFEQMHKKWK